MFQVEPSQIVAMVVFMLASAWFIAFSRRTGKSLPLAIKVGMAVGSVGLLYYMARVIAAVF